MSRYDQTPIYSPKISETGVTRHSLQSTASNFKFFKTKKIRKIKRKTGKVSKFAICGTGWNMRGKKKISLSSISRRKKALSSRLRISKSQSNVDFSVPAPRVLVQSQSVKMKMLDYSSSVEDPEESWLWDSEDEEFAQEGEFAGPSFFKKADPWVHGDKVNYLEVTNITRSVVDLNGDIERGTLKKKKKKDALVGEKKKKRTKKAQGKKGKKISKKKISKKLNKNSNNCRNPKEAKINDIYKAQRPVNFSQVHFCFNNKKYSFRCFPYDSTIIKFSKPSQKNKLIGKDMDDDFQTDDEIQRDAINFLFKKFKSGLKKACNYK